MRARAGCSRRSPLATLTGVQIQATGSYVPERVVTNDDLAALGIDPDWIVQRTGIHQRRFAEPGQATSDMGLLAAERCIERAGVDLAEIDLVIVATMTPDSLMPSTACYLQHRLGIVAPAMDINAACAGFTYALTTGCQFVKTGTSRCVLVVGADTNSRIVNPKDKKTYPLFGDGAGAVLLGPGTDQQGMLAFTLGAEGDGADLLKIPAGGSRRPLDAQALAEGQQFMHMDGRSVFKWAVRVIADGVNDVLDHAGLTIADIDLFVLHQANIRIIDAAIESIGVDPAKVVVNLNRYGNTSAASIPIGLDESIEDQRIKPGDKVLMCGFGAGLAWGASIFQW